MKSLEKKFLELTDKWKRLGKGPPIIRWDSEVHFVICEVESINSTHPLDSIDSISNYASSASIEDALDIALEFTNEDIQRKQEQYFSQAELLVQKARSLGRIGRD